MRDRCLPKQTFKSSSIRAYASYLFGAAPKETGGASFADVLAGAVTEVQRLQTEADSQIRQLVAGEVKDPSAAMVAIEKADVSFQTMMAIRNKMVEAYQEVMRMQV